MTLQEGCFESMLQFMLQLYILFSRASLPSKWQLFTLSSSLFSLGKTGLNAEFRDKKRVSLLKKIKILPIYLSQHCYLTGSCAIIASIFKEMCIIPVIIWVMMSSCFWHISDLEEEKKYGAINLFSYIIMFLILCILIVFVNCCPNIVIYHLDYNSFWKIPFDLSNVIVHQKLSDVPIVREGWANYIIPLVMVSFVISCVLYYFKYEKPQRIVKVSDKNDPKKLYEIPIGTLKEAPLENKVINVKIEDRTYVVPIKDFQLDMYPLHSNVRPVVKCSKLEKTSKHKVFIVKKDDLTELAVTKTGIKNSNSEQEQMEII